MELIGVLIIAAWMVWWMRHEERELERRRTAPERARRARRSMELDYMGGCAAAGDHCAERYLQETLIADLRALRDRRWAQEYLREHYGL
jgi:hypothetical protein